ncbi:MAG: LON peptidase substrate-binding domain-containing protein, partial [Desulfobulbaceae bacterium]|nr:LON peptidase substrate-binding domain-containing protein [Desulfobulbaceae bacterium]
MSETSRSMLLPVLPLKNAVVFPHVALPISVGRPASVAAVEMALVNKEKMLLILSQHDADIDEPQAADLFRV